MTLDAPTVGIGMVLLAIGVDWRVRVVRRRRAALRTRLAAALHDSDPAMRRAAAAVAVQQGVAATGELLLEVIAGEHDVGVLDAIAEAIAQNQWEPCDHPPVLELRLWSAHRLARRADQRREEAARLELEQAAARAAIELPLLPPPEDDPVLVSANGHLENDQPQLGRVLAQLAATRLRRRMPPRWSSGADGHGERPQ